MPIARVMNMPDGSTPIPQMGGGDVNGTLARSILWQHAGTGAIRRDIPAHLVAQTTQTGIPGAVAPLNAMALDELEKITRLEDSARAELHESRAEEQHGIAEPADSEPGNGNDAGNGSSDTARTSRRRRR